MIATLLAELTEGLRTNSCNVIGPVDAAGAVAAIAERVEGVAACNADVPLTGLRERLVAVLDPADPDWSLRLPNAAVGITGARLAVAAPATIALVAAPGSPRATSLVPPAHICVLRTGDVVASLADAIDRLGGDLPSALTWIGGPSRTGDLEMIQTLGIHGPQRVHVILLEDDAVGRGDV